MATRKKVLTKRPAFRMREMENTADENDLKKVKAQALKELEEKKLAEKDWYDKELEKNLKKQ